MKKIIGIALLVILSVFAGCSKEEDSEVMCQVLLLQQLMERHG